MELSCVDDWSSVSGKGISCGAGDVSGLIVDPLECGRGPEDCGLEDSRLELLLECIGPCADLVGKFLSWPL